MKQYIYLLMFLISVNLSAQEAKSYYNGGNTSTQVKYVGAGYLPGTIVLKDGTELKGQVRGSSYSGNNVRSFKFRTKKGEKAQVFKADACKLVLYDGLIIISLPKKLKKMEGKRSFYVALYYGKYLTVFQDPDANVVERSPGSISFNDGQMLSYLMLKDKELHKISKLRFRKRMLEACNDSKKFVERAKDKKWFTYDNVYKVAHFYNQTRGQ
jgi:hypothetical protein